MSADNLQNTNAEQANPGRDAKGRFVVGNMGGTGNPFARKVGALRQALIDSVTAQDIQDVAAKLLEQAKAGNIQAAKLFLNYTVGKPQPAPEPDRLDADEMHVFEETKELRHQSPELMHAGTPEHYLRMVRAMREVISGIRQMEINKVLLETPEERQARAAAELAEFERRINTPTPNLEGIDLEPFRRNVTFPPVPEPAPSPDGGNGEHPPSPDGGNGEWGPSPDGKKRRPGHDRYEPAANGVCG